jgi:hypothetical protein
MPYLNKTKPKEPFSPFRTAPNHPIVTTRFLYPLDLSHLLAERLQKQALTDAISMNNAPIPAISVAMSVYNAEQFLASAINSILTQNFSDNWYLEDNLTFLQQIGLVP